LHKASPAKLELWLERGKLFMGLLRLILWNFINKIFVCGAAEDMIRAMHYSAALKGALSGERSILKTGV